MLSDDERRELIHRARYAARRALGVPAGPPPGPPGGVLSEPGAAFVTWRKEGRLRGCVGSVLPERALAADVEANAVDALLHDPRFPPATPRDLPRYEVEISVLGPLEPIGGPGDVEIGRHGLYVEKGSRAGLLLPQVPLEWGWDAARFLEQTCLKAGLPGDAWRAAGKGLALYRFAAEVFSQADFRPASA